MNNELSDHELLIKLQQAKRRNDVKAIRQFFNALYRRHEESFYIYVKRKVSSSHDAEDIVQEVFSRIYRYIHAYNSDGNALAWMKKIRENELINTLRYRKEHSVESLDDQPEYVFLSVESDPSAIIDFQEEMSIYEKQIQVAEETLKSFSRKERAMLTEALSSPEEVREKTLQPFHRRFREFMEKIT